MVFAKPAPVSAGAMERWGEWFASRPTGQFVVNGVDSVLRLIEKSLMWSTQTALRPTSCSEAGVEDADSRLVVVARPLSWPLFLPLLGVLGVVRVTVYYVTRVFRKPRDTTDMIQWLQSKRRRLRAVRLAGLKNIRERNSEARPDRTPNGTPSAKAKIASSTTPDHERKRKYDDVEQSDWTDAESDDESLVEKLAKAQEESDSEDPDFEPKSDEEASDDEVSSDSDAEEDEVALLKKDAEVPIDDLAALSIPVPASPSIVTVESPESPKPMQNLQPALEVV